MNSSSLVGTPRRDYMNDSSLLSTPRRDDSLRSLNNTLNRSDLSIYSAKSKVLTYETLRERALARRVLFEDPDFPADSRSLQIRYKSSVGAIEWKRPHEISRRPKFIAKNPGLFEVVPGPLAENWLLPAFSCLTLAPSLIQRCIPEDQAFDDKYAGIFRFRFWRYGEWIELCIDDRLPTFNGKLLLTRNNDPNEFWAALFEKAYAKLYGSYGAIKGNLVNWALQDLTGGITDNFVFKDNPQMLKQIVDVCMARTSLISTSIQLPEAPGQVRQLNNGLVTARAYTINGYAEIPVQGQSAILIRLKNPWGPAQWLGTWSARSHVWSTVSEGIKQKLGLADLHESEFWMGFSDFSKHFTHLEICHLSPESWHLEPKLKHRSPWKSVEAHRQWRRGFNAAGGISSPLMHCNSQFYFELKQQCCVVLSLMQKYRLLGETRDFVPCGCLIFQAPQSRETRLQMNHFLLSRHVASTHICPDRDIVRFFTLPAGSYVILPVTAQAGMEGKFLLRLFTDDKSTVVRELDDPDTASFLQTNPGTNQEDELVDRQLDPDNLLILRRRFMMVCNRYEEIDAYGLQQILSYRHTERRSRSILCCESQSEEVKIQRVFLSTETCKAAITIVDKDMNGRLTYDEFMTLLQKLTLWQGIFSKYKVGNGSVMDTYSLRNALRIAGFSCSNRILEGLVLRFAAKDIMNLEGFINSVVKLHVAHQITALIERHRSAREDMKIENEQDKRKYLQELLRTAIYS